MLLIIVDLLNRSVRFVMITFIKLRRRKAQLDFGLPEKYFDFDGMRPQDRYLYLIKEYDKYCFTLYNDLTPEEKSDEFALSYYMRMIGNASG